MSQYGQVKDTLRDPVKLGKVFPAGYMDPDQVRANALVDVLNEARLAGGINPIVEVNDCETAADWTESDDGTFDIAADSTNEKVGSNAMSLTATAACDGTQYVETSIIRASQAIPNDKYGETGGIDWTGFDWFGGWWFGGGAAHFDGLGELQLNIKNDGVWGTAVNIIIPTGSADLPPMIPTNAVHKLFDVDITSFARNKVQAIRIYCACPTVGQSVSIDDLKVYKYSTGRGPCMGPCMPYTPADGVQISRGDIVKFTAGTTHRIGETAAAEVIDIGVCVIPALGDINSYPPKQAWIQYAGHCYLRCNAATVAGESLIWQSESATLGHLVEGGATGVDENAFAKGYEAAGAQYDDILAEVVRTATFIS